MSDNQEINVVPGYQVSGRFIPQWQWVKENGLPCENSPHHCGGPETVSRCSHCGRMVAPEEEYEPDIPRTLKVRDLLITPEGKLAGVELEDGSLLGGIIEGGLMAGALTNKETGERRDALQLVFAGQWSDSIAKKEPSRIIQPSPIVGLNGKPVR